MKKIREFIGSDMFNHIGMSGPDIVKFFDPAAGMTGAEKLEYVKGIATVYPHMFLMNYSGWKFENEEAPDYKPFMDASVPALQAKVFPALEKCYDDANPLTEAERGELLIPLFTDVIPFTVLPAYYNYMYANDIGKKDINEWVNSVRPQLQLLLGDVVLKAVYNDEKPMDYKAKTEVFLFVATRMASLLLKSYHDWHFGAETIEMGPPPDGEGPGGPPPGM